MKTQRCEEVYGVQTWTGLVMSARHSEPVHPCKDKTLLGHHPTGWKEIIAGPCPLADWSGSACAVWTHSPLVMSQRDKSWKWRVIDQLISWTPEGEIGAL